MTVSSSVVIRVNGREQEVPEGIPLIVALFNGGITHFRTSVSGEPRAPICAMGTCFECRVMVDGKEHQRSCLIPCVGGMVIHTGDR
jgi:sarcosine oxidase subunit alpha